MRILFFISFICFAQTVMAQTPLSLEPGKTVTVQNGALSLVMQGKVVWSAKLEGVTAETKTELSAHVLSDGLLAIHVVTSDKDSSKREVVALYEQGKKRLRVIFEADTGLKGDIGERIGKAVQFEDLNGDNQPEIIVGEVSEAVKLCGQKRRPLLFRRVFDTQTGKFRPILAKRPGLGHAIDIKSTVSGDDQAPLVLKSIAASGASRTADDSGNVLMLSKPRAMTDNTPETWWSPWPGNGAGEFATFSTAMTAYGVTQIGIRVHTGRLKKKQYDRPQSILLSTDTALYRLNFVSDPVESPDSVYWFKLPEPVSSSCLSLVIESSFDAGLHTPVALSEVFVKTEIDGPEGLSRLASDLDNESRRRQAAMLLKRAKKQAMVPIKKRWKSLKPLGRRLAVEVVGEVDPEGGVELLAEAALGKDALTKNTALQSLRKIPDTAIGVLEKYLSTQDTEEFEAALGIISALGGSSALAAIADHAGDGPPKMRRQIRDALSRFARSAKDTGEQLWALTQAAQEQDAWEKCVDLLRVAVLNPALHERIFQLVDQVFDEKKTFNDRYRLLAIIGQLECTFPKTRLLQSLSDSDIQIRAISLTGIGMCMRDHADFTQALLRGLRDPEPPVRLAALDSLASTEHLAPLFPEIVKLAANDMWPRVRAEAVSTAIRFPEPKALSILEKGAADRSLIVRQTAMEGAFQFHSPRADRIIERGLLDPDEANLTKLRAIAQIGKRCQTSALSVLNALLKIGKEPLAPFEAVELAVAAARTMGTIGTPQAKEMLKKAKERSNPATDKAINAALGSQGACPQSP